MSKYEVGKCMENREVSQKEYQDISMIIYELTNSIKKTPYEPNLYLMRGAFFNILFRFTDAIDDFQKAENLSGGKFSLAENYLLRGITFLKVSKWGDAVDDFKRALQIKDSLNDIRILMELYYRLSFAYNKIGDLPKSLLFKKRLDYLEKKL